VCNRNEKGEIFYCPNLLQCPTHDHHSHYKATKEKKERQSPTKKRKRRTNEEMKEKKTTKIPRFDLSACTTNEEIDKELALISDYKKELCQKKEENRKSKMSIFQLRKYEHNVSVPLIDLTQ
jgi:hypothetical protein